ncbi:adenylyltransferase/cytidyltransferase family protein, partial [Salmonella enterica]|nr:adenylyltransferase/cytidyltransferase family protein [Salmonella enterica]
FDPFTNGHLDIVLRAAKLFDEVLIAVSENISKTALFNVDQRMAMIERALETSEHKERIRVIKHQGGLTVELAHTLKVKAMIRGIRSVKDME